MSWPRKKVLLLRFDYPPPPAPMVMGLMLTSGPLLPSRSVRVVQRFAHESGKAAV